MTGIVSKTIHYLKPLIDTKSEYFVPGVVDLTEEDPVFLKFIELSASYRS